MGRKKKSKKVSGFGEKKSPVISEVVSESDEAQHLAYLASVSSQMQKSIEAYEIGNAFSLSVIYKDGVIDFRGVGIEVDRKFSIDLNMAASGSRLADSYAEELMESMREWFDAKVDELFLILVTCLGNEPSGIYKTVHGFMEFELALELQARNTLRSLSKIKQEIEEIDVKNPPKAEWSEADWSEEE